MAALQALFETFDLQYGMLSQAMFGEKAVSMTRGKYRTVRKTADLLQGNEDSSRRRIKEGEPRAIEIGKGSPIGPDDPDAFLGGHATRPAGNASGGAHAAQGQTGARETKGHKTCST